MTRIEKLTERALNFYDNGDPSHDRTHIQRVLKTCATLAREEGADLEIVHAAALLHDVVNLPKNHPERAQASRMAAEKSQFYLEEAGFSANEIERVKTAITEHSFSLGKKPSTIESAVLQDADRLDSLGAIGIWRTVTCGARMGSSYYEPNEPFARDRAFDDKAFTLDHFFVKLFKLADSMNTPAAKREALRRTDLMKTFLSDLKREIEGEF